MKIIQPSRRFKKVDGSKNDSSSKDHNQELVYKELDKGSLTRSRKSKTEKSTRLKSKNSAHAKSKFRSKRDGHGLAFGSSQHEDELDFDTSKLEAMPKEDILIASPEGKRRRRSELLLDKKQEPLKFSVDPSKKEFNELFARGVRLLAMREHSVDEMINKLMDRRESFGDTEGSNTVHAVVDELLEKKYLSDERFTESYIRARGNRGFGPVKIKAELKNKGVSSDLIQDALDEGASYWFDNAQSQYQKKYGDVPISDYNVWTKRARFMQSRGFTMEHIHVTVPRIEFD